MSTFERVGKSIDGKTITLHQLDSDSMFQSPPYFNADWEKSNSDLIRWGAVLDVETTGLSHDQDHIIEIGIRQFRFNRQNGDILRMENAYSSFQDPGQPITEEITRLTGITNEMVLAQSIDWARVDQMISESQIVIAHNASFDRPFIDKKSSISGQRIWACSLNQINWAGKGLPSQKLEILSLYHGFFNSAHRALSDADTLLYLLSLKDQSSGESYFQELLNQARKIFIYVAAHASPFETKDLLRARDYRWDAAAKVWSKKITKEEWDAEQAWLESEIYRGRSQARIEEISPLDHFKARRS